MVRRTLFFLFFFIAIDSFGQNVPLEPGKLVANRVSMSFEKITGKKSLRIVKDSSVKDVDEPTFVMIKDLELNEGSIEVKVLSRLLPNAPETARGFIGLAFRINDSCNKYECIYIRPTNGRSNDQVRRNHSIQYYSYPDYKFDRLRKETPERYESYADMQLNQWITMRIDIKGSEAKLYLGKKKQPVLIVNDLKHGSSLS